MKRVFDITVSLAALVLCAPLFVLEAFLIKADSRGSIFYRGVRIGHRGKPFEMLKFRTMVSDADKIGGASAANDDRRITRVGKFLRRHKLDEIPQLVNVINGDMSLVGPRPEVPQYVAMFTEAERKILNVKPGLTDWATLWNSDEGTLLAGSSDPERTYLEKIRPEKLRLQLKYVNERSLGTDLKILFLTLVKLFRR